MRSFRPGSGNLKPGSISDLDQLVGFLGKHPDRTVIIEGHTDNVGSEDFTSAIAALWRRFGPVVPGAAGCGPVVSGPLAWARACRLHRMTTQVDDSRTDA